jgi:hypothetical protein
VDASPDTTVVLLVAMLTTVALGKHWMEAGLIMVG